MRDVIYQIGDLIEEHCQKCKNGNKRHQECCTGCEVYNELQNMGHQLDFLAKRKRVRARAEILSKGQDMTIQELRTLLERYKVSKKTIRKALRMDSAAFYTMLHNLGLSEPVKEMMEK